MDVLSGCVNLTDRLGVAVGVVVVANSSVEFSVIVGVPVLVMVGVSVGVSAGVLVGVSLEMCDGIL